MMNREDSSPVKIGEVVVGDDESGKAGRSQGSFRDVDLKAALERLFGENGSADMFSLIYAASQRGRKLKERWYEKSLWGFLLVIFTVLSLSISSAVAVKLYFL